MTPAMGEAPGSLWSVASSQVFRPLIKGAAFSRLTASR